MSNQHKTKSAFWAYGAREERLRKHYATTPTHELAAELGCTEKQLRRRAYTLGLKKRPDAISHARSAQNLRAKAAAEALARKAMASPGPRMLNNANSRGLYTGQELKPTTSATPERMRAYSLPSRVGNKRYYPDGRIEEIDT